MLTHVMFGSIRNRHMAVSIWSKFGGALAHLVVRRTFGRTSSWRVCWRVSAQLGELGAHLELAHLADGLKFVCNKC
jgi:hypothetical protein